MPDPQRDPLLPETSRAAPTRKRRLVHLSIREYLPLLGTVGLWSVILLAIGTADTARLFAASILSRAILMLTRMSTARSIRLRSGAERSVRRHARSMARRVQIGALGINVLLLVVLASALSAIGQDEIAFFLPLIAVGWPSRVLRFSDARTGSPYYRLAMSGSGLALALAGWAAGLGALGVGLAFGMREWVAFAVIRFWPRSPRDPLRPREDRLRFAEIARFTALSGRRLLTYRLTKVALTVFGPFGNFAARTGRGMGWHNRIEPFLPHRLSGFILFSLATAGGALFLVLRSGAPAAMVGAAGLMQLAAVSANIAALWKYLPDRDDPALEVDEDDGD